MFGGGNGNSGGTKNKKLARGHELSNLKIKVGREPKGFYRELLVIKKAISLFFLSFSKFYSKKY